MPPHAFDVVVVPDFSEPEVAGRFETLTLFFLASWLEFGGRSRELPLHIAAIGEAPESVRVLAGKCGARITTHDPFLFGTFANKLRGFEVDRQTDHVLLLDSDMLVLSDIQGLPASLGGGDCMAAAPSLGNRRKGPELWEKIHEHLGLPSPEDQVIPLNIELDTFQCAPYRDWDHFPPYYNGGLVYAPWSSRLGDTWRDHLERILEFTHKIRGPKRKVSNQPSLATAIHAVRLGGVELRMLPDEYRVHWQHIATGAVSSRETKLLHTVGFGRWSAKTADGSARQQIDIYLANILRLTRSLRSHRGLLTRAAHILTRRPQIRDCHRIHAILRRLYEGYVGELKP
jgi:hypothetical protein